MEPPTLSPLGPVIDPVMSALLPRFARGNECARRMDTECVHWMPSSQKASDKPAHVHENISTPQALTIQGSRW